jgi:acyl carrier protein
MDLVVSLEREYGIALELGDMVRMVSVAAIADVLRGKGVDLGS